MILGAVLAGGQSSRFGSDKALAELDGRTLLARAVEALQAQCDAVVVVGREDAPVPTLPDRPRPGMGPLGGIAAALHHAADTATTPC
jgi:molybdopterin-guanine dinucleotide biosynthesis protein A